MRWILLLCTLVAPLAAQHTAAAAGGPTTGEPLRVFRDGELVVSVQRRPGMPVALATDFRTGRFGALLPVAGDTLQLTYVDNGARLPSPERFSFTVDGGGRPALLIREVGKPDRLLPELPMQVKEVTFQNGTISLSGLMVAPVGATRVPGVVFLHGSGPSTRGLFPSWSGLLASRGIASLAYDKRGTGASSGNYQTSTLAQLADDARAAVATLRAHPSVDSSLVGLWGESQGPWIAAMMLASDPTLAFSVATSGGGVTGEEQELFRRTKLVADSGYSASEVAAAREFIAAYFSYLKSGGSDSVTFRPIWQRNASAKWLRLVAPTSDPTQGEWPPARRAFAVDLALPLATYYQQSQQPMLALFGSDDANVPPALAIAHLERELPRAKEGQLTTRVLPGADHGLHLPAVAGDMPKMHPEYVSTILNWLTKTLERPRALP